MLILSTPFERAARLGRPLTEISSRSLYVDLPLPDWRTLRRLRTEGGCPQPIPGQHLTWTVVCTVTPDGFWDHAIAGWRGELHDCPLPPLWWQDIGLWAAVTTSFITTPGTNATWTVAGTFNPGNNQVEAIGTGGAAVSASNAHTGGGGGAYAIAINVSVSGSTLYTIDIASDTMFKNTGTLVAKCGAVSTTGTSPAPGGAGASCVPSTGAHSGGNGAGVGPVAGSGGGGGSAGPHGDGKAGGNMPSSNAGGGGGGADGQSSTAASSGQGGTGPSGIAGGAAGSTGGAAAAQSGAGGGGGTGATGGAGGSGVPTWTQTSDSATAGPGGGGGATGGAGGGTSGAGGTYGGGAGGRTGTGTISAGGQGIIVPTWTPGGAFRRQLRTFLLR